MKWNYFEKKGYKQNASNKSYSVLWLEDVNIIIHFDFQVDIGPAVTTETKRAVGSGRHRERSLDILIGPTGSRKILDIQKTVWKYICRKEHGLMQIAKKKISLFVSTFQEVRKFLYCVASCFSCVSLLSCDLRTLTFVLLLIPYNIFV